MDLVLKHMSTLHHEFHPLQLCDVGGRIALHCYQISKLSSLDRSYAILPAHQSCSFDCCCSDRQHRCHAELHHIFEFLRLGSVRKWSHTRSEGDFYSLCDRPG